MNLPGEHSNRTRPLPNVYFQTIFLAKESDIDWPPEFAIITAWAPTGMVWSDERNRLADQRLFAELSRLDVWLKRLTGQSPDGHHAEPGWAVEVDFQTACDIGNAFKQVAIYFVSDNRLNVSYCDERRELVFFDSFLNRVLPGPGD